MYEDQKTYFTNEALARFVVAQGKTVEKVVCHLWQNTIQENATVEIIDNVELQFQDGERLTISCNAEGTGLDAVKFDYKATAFALHDEFKGRIKLFAVNASTTTMWENVIGKKLNKVRVTREGEFYKADSVILEFEDELREISIAPLDGLIIDYYEED
jgi:hypothetical protein